MTVVRVRSIFMVQYAACFVTQIKPVGGLGSAVTMGRAFVLHMEEIPYGHATAVQTCMGRTVVSSVSQILVATLMGFVTNLLVHVNVPMASPGSTVDLAMREDTVSIVI